MDLFRNNKELPILDVHSNGRLHASPEKHKGEEPPLMDLGRAIVNNDSIGGNEV